MIKRLKWSDYLWIQYSRKGKRRGDRETSLACSGSGKFNYSTASKGEYGRRILQRKTKDYCLSLWLPILYYDNGIIESHCHKRFNFFNGEIYFKLHFAVRNHPGNMTRDPRSNTCCCWNPPSPNLNPVCTRVLVILGLFGLKEARFCKEEFSCVI